MAIITKKTYPAVGTGSQSSTTVFTDLGIEINNQDDLDVYVTKTTAGIAANNGLRIKHYRQNSTSPLDDTHPQVGDTTGLYSPALTHTGGTETLNNYLISADNTTITFNTALPSGAIVTVERRTRDASSDYTSFAGGSTIRHTDLNNSAKESRFTAQEARNKSFELESKLFGGELSDNVNIGGNLTVAGNTTFSSTASGTTLNLSNVLSVAGNALFYEDVTLGNVAGDKVYINSRIASNIVPENSSINLGQSGSNRFGSIYGTTLDTTSNTTVGGTLTTSTVSSTGALNLTSTNNGAIKLNYNSNQIFAIDSTGIVVDDNILPGTDGTYDIGSNGLEFNDLYIDGTAHIDTLDVDGNATVAGTLDVTGNTTVNNFECHNVKLSSSMITTSGSTGTLTDTAGNITCELTTNTSSTFTLSRASNFQSNKSINFFIKGYSGKTIAWSGVTWVGGSEPTISTTKWHYIKFIYVAGVESGNLIGHSLGDIG